MQQYNILNRILRSYDRKTQLLRGRILRLRGALISTGVGIGNNVRIEFPDHLSIEYAVTILDNSFLHCKSSNGVRIGHNTSFHYGFWLHCGGEIGNWKPGFFHIGHHCFIGPYGIMGAGGGICIGNHVQLGPMVTIHAENHLFSTVTKRIDEQGVTHKGVVIEDDCWIGAKVTILDGVTIGQGCVIGAGSVVTRNIEPYSIAFGNPAKVIRSRRSTANWV